MIVRVCVHAFKKVDERHKQAGDQALSGHTFCACVVKSRFGHPHGCVREAAGGRNEEFARSGQQERVGSHTAAPEGLKVWSVKILPRVFRLRYLSPSAAWWQPHTRVIA